jgi:hypothetical protein
LPDNKTQPTFIAKLDVFFEITVRICIFLASVSLVFMTVFYVWLVYGRYVLNDTPTWVEQVSSIRSCVSQRRSKAHSELFCAHNRSPNDRFWWYDVLVWYPTYFIQMEYIDPADPSVRGF